MGYRENWGRQERSGEQEMTQVPDIRTLEGRSEGNIG
jgi:hypothetical protein